MRGSGWGWAGTKAVKKSEPRRHDWQRRNKRSQPASPKPQTHMQAIPHTHARSSHESLGAAIIIQRVFFSLFFSFLCLLMTRSQQRQLRAALITTCDSFPALIKGHQEAAQQVDFPHLHCILSVSLLGKHWTIPGNLFRSQNIFSPHLCPHGMNGAAVLDSCCLSFWS